MVRLTTIKNPRSNLQDSFRGTEEPKWFNKLHPFRFHKITSVLGPHESNRLADSLVLLLLLLLLAPFSFSDMSPSDNAPSTPNGVRPIEAPSPPSPLRLDGSREGVVAEGFQPDSFLWTQLPEVLRPLPDSPESLAELLMFDREIKVALDVAYASGVRTIPIGLDIEIGIDVVVDEWLVPVMERSPLAAPLVAKMLVAVNHLLREYGVSGLVVLRGEDSDDMTEYSYVSVRQSIHEVSFKFNLLLTWMDLVYGLTRHGCVMLMMEMTKPHDFVLDAGVIVMLPMVRVGFDEHPRTPATSPTSVLTSPMSADVAVARRVLFSPPPLVRTRAASSVFYTPLRRTRARRTLDSPPEASSV